MTERLLTEEMMAAFETYLIEEERSKATVEKYKRDIRAFYNWLPDEKLVTKECMMTYKQFLSEKYKAASTNSMLVALNNLWSYLTWPECRVRLLKLQRKSFRELDKELNRNEYQRLVQAARTRRNERLDLLIQTICSTGIRVSEHRYITVETLEKGRARIVNKGKERTVFLPPKLCVILQRYCRKRGIVNGPVFITKGGKPLNRSNIWAEMKKLCLSAQVSREKVFPHNLRHLFALSFYQLEKDIVRLADILGHASIETTRIYTMTSSVEQVKKLNQLRLVI
ncbi:tyrosine-type recombinase/integrase [Clostridium sp. MCC353]|uniref:tyrosine-type recombinase/integrase n=1 Tax=Clostridium sp. MCC353 TaxID=2592646 RepID=UPI001C00D9ED|nr:tyrosine-type recombinase/integrase [Clostridium sp. MCC353]MBT9778285.1 tyrosine-type recombinase/integrase [Clostridium sp. MCC353]